MAIAPLIVQVRATGAGALTRTAAQIRAVAAATQAATSRMTAHTRAVSSVTGVYRDANGLWRNANGTLLTQRHTVTQVTTAYGRLANAVNSAGRAMRRMSVNTLHNLGDTAQSIAAAMARWASVLAAIAPFIAVIGNVIANLVPLLFHLAPAAVAAGAALLTLKLGLTGVGDALKAGLSGNVDDFNKALSKLAPAAQSFVRELVNIAPAWRDLRKLVQEKLFAGLAGEVRKVSDALGPIATTWLPQLASQFNRFFLAIAKGLQSPEFARQMEVIMQGVSVFIDGALHAVRMLGRAFLDVAEVAAPAFGQLGAQIGIAAEKFSVWIQAMKDSGTLKRWLDQAKETFNQLVSIGKEVGRVFSALFKGTDEKGFLESLRVSIKKLADFLHSGEGQAVIQYFATLAIGAVRFIGMVIGAIQWLIDGIKRMREDVRGASGAIGAAFAAIGGAARAMFAVMSAGAGAFAWIGGVLGRLGGLVAGVRNAVSAINAALNSIRTLVTINIVTRHSNQGYIKPINTAGGGGGIKFMARGGDVAAGQPVVVGDGGRPELFIPNQSGRILPSVPSARRSPSGSTPGGMALSSTSSGLEALFERWLLNRIRNGYLPLRVVGNRVVPA